MRKKHNKEFNDLMSKNPANWKGIFYFNWKDPRVSVPKLDHALGWTINFANPYAYIIIIAVAGIIATSMYLGLF